MNKFFFFIVLAFLNKEKLVAQANLYTYKIAFLLPENNETTPAALFEMLFNGHTVKANDQGIVYFTRETGADNLMVSLADAKYIIVGPSFISFPENPTFITTILLHKKSDKEKASADYIKRLKGIHIDLNELSKANEALSIDNKLIKQQMDSVLSVITKQYKLNDNDIRDAAEILAGQDKYFGLITSSLEGYLNEAKDIRDVFKNMLGFYLENPASFRLLDSIVTVYNKYYNDLNNNNNEYERAVETYWQSHELALGFHSVYDYAINDIHRTWILSLNTKIVEKANIYIHENNKKQKKTIKDELLDALNDIIPILDNNLVVLENKIKYYVGQLTFQKNILNK